MVLRNENFVKWLTFLSNIRNGKNNSELLYDYFFHVFAKYPLELYGFMNFIKEKIIQQKNPKEKKILASHYLEIISPLCQRFGFSEKKDQLDNFCFKIADPERFNEIDAVLSKYKESSKELINGISTVLKVLLRKNNYICKVKGRYKNIYSIHKKLVQKNKNHVLQLRDIFAFRIILKSNSISRCFKVANILHDKFIPIAEHYKDYITVPKINGYQSLHTCLLGVLPNFDFPIEVQIRTKFMDDFAENGLAAHWIYSKHKKTKLCSEKEEKLVNYYYNLADDNDPSEMVYFLSYTGDLYRLVKGATVIDFAYHIHTDLGNRVHAAIVNGEIKSKDYKIEEADIIKIEEASHDTVKLDWLKVANSKNTRKIHEKIHT